MTVSPGLCPLSVKAAISGTYMRKISTSGFWISSNPSSPGKNVPLRESVQDITIAIGYVPEHMTPVLSIRDRVEAQIELCFDNFLYRCIFNCLQVFLASLAFVNCMSHVQKRGWAKERAQMLSPERRPLMELRGHGDVCSM